MQNGFIQKIVTKWMAISKAQKLTTVLCTVLALVLVIGAGIGIASMGKNKDTVGTESTQGSEALFPGHH